MIHQLIIIFLIIGSIFYWGISVAVCLVSHHGLKVMEDFHKYGVSGFLPWLLFVLVLFPLIGFPIYLLKVGKAFTFNAFKMFNVIKFFTNFFTLNYAAIKKTIKYEHR